MSIKKAHGMVSVEILGREQPLRLETHALPVSEHDATLTCKHLWLKWRWQPIVLHVFGIDR